MSRIALLAGATGLVGRELLKLLLETATYTQLRVLVRRPLGIHHPRLQEIVVDYDRLAALGDALKADDVFCCLGTTLRKAGSKAAFAQVDHGYVLALARAARAVGARRFLVISAVGSSERSAAFYSQVKARMEKDVTALGFESTHILRPSLLLGDREERRPAEQLSQRLSPLLAPLLSGPLRKYRPVEAGTVAHAMLALAQGTQTGVHVHHLPLEN